MKIIGFSLKKGEFRYSVLEGTKASPILIEKDARVVISASSTPALLDWFYTTYQEIINSVKPNKITYKQLLKPLKAQLGYISYPEAILNLVGHSSGLSVQAYTTLNFTPSKFGLAKGIDIYAQCDKTFGIKPPKWDRDQKYSILAAWIELP